MRPELYFSDFRQTDGADGGEEAGRYTSNSHRESDSPGDLSTSDGVLRAAEGGPVDAMCRGDTSTRLPGAMVESGVRMS